MISIPALPKSIVQWGLPQGRTPLAHRRAPRGVKDALPWHTVGPVEVPESLASLTQTPLRNLLWLWQL